MQVLAQDNVPSLVLASITSITLASTNNGQDTRITVGGQQYKNPGSIVIALSTTTTGFGGLDTGLMTSNTLYYIYAVVSGGNLGLVLSLNNPSIGPTGFAGYRFVGRTRTFLGSTSLAAIITAAEFQPALYATSLWTSFASVIKGATSDPTKGPNIEASRSRRVGDSMELEFHYAQSSGGSAGSGLYYILVPGNFSLDPVRIPNGEVLAVGSVFGGPNSSMIGTALAGINFFAANTQGVGASIMSSTVSINYWGSSQNPLTGIMQMRFHCMIPIAEFVGLFQ